MAGSVDTHGWDTVFAVSIDVVNLFLARVPATASFTHAIPAGQGSQATLNWGFGNWRITDVPGGNQITITLSFTPGSQLTRDGQASVPLGTGWSCVVTFEAHFDTTDPTTHRLVARTAEGKNWATVKITIPTGVSQIDESAVELALADWFRNTPDAIATFEQEFAAVDIGARAADAGLEWLRPTAVAYAGRIMANGVTKALGILAMTGPNGPERAEKATLKLSPDVIQGNEASGFIISERLFLENMLMPACAGAFGGNSNQPSQHFAVYHDGKLQLSNHAQLSFTEKYKEMDRAATFIPRALSLNFEDVTEGDVTENFLTMRMAPLNIETDVAGWSVDVTSTRHYRAKLASKEKAPDEKIFLMENKDFPDPTVKAVQAEWSKWFQWGFATLLAIASIVLGVVSFKGRLATLRLDAAAAKLWARIIAAFLAIGGLAAGGIPFIIEAALNGKTDDLPDLGGFLSAQLGRISWPGEQELAFVPITASFANGLLIAIEPRPPA